MLLTVFQCSEQKLCSNIAQFNLTRAQSSLSSVLNRRPFALLFVIVASQCTLCKLADHIVSSLDRPYHLTRHPVTVESTDTLLCSDRNNLLFLQVWGEVTVSSGRIAGEMGDQIGLEVRHCHRNMVILVYEKLVLFLCQLVEELDLPITPPRV